MLLEVDAVELAYGEVPACRDLSLEVGEGEIVALIGANGAGKSTTLRGVAGAMRPRRGRILFQGKDVTRMPAHERARAGIALVPEGRRVFPALTVRENLEMGGFKLRREPARLRAQMERMYGMFPRLRERSAQPAGTLSGGEQQMLALGRALMSEPQLLCMDEPSLGLAPLIVRQIFDAIKTLNSREGLTVFLVEQNAFHALRLANRGYVMVNGRITLSGSGRELLDHPEIKAAYLEGGRQKAAG